jgi:hypothetical protein
MEQRQPVANQLLQAGGDRQVIEWRARVASPEEGAADLEREERVAAGYAMKTGKRQPRERSAKASIQKSVELRAVKAPSRRRPMRPSGRARSRSSSTPRLPSSRRASSRPTRSSVKRRAAKASALADG